MIAGFYPTEQTFGMLSTIACVGDLAGANGSTTRLAYKQPSCNSVDVSKIGYTYMFWVFCSDAWFHLCCRLDARLRSCEYVGDDITCFRLSELASCCPLWLTCWP
jgi:hypothetical protein